MWCQSTTFMLCAGIILSGCTSNTISESKSEKKQLHSSAPLKTGLQQTTPEVGSNTENEVLKKQIGNHPSIGSDLSENPEKYITAFSTISGKFGEVETYTCSHFLCQVSGTSSSVRIPFRLTVSLKEKYKDGARKLMQKIQLKLAPRFLVKQVVGDKNFSNTYKFKFGVGSRKHGSFYRAYELNAKNNYSVTSYHDTKVFLLKENRNGEKVETHHMEGATADIVRSRIGERFDDLYANELDASPDLAKKSL